MDIFLDTLYIFITFIIACAAHVSKPNDDASVIAVWWSDYRRQSIFDGHESTTWSAADTDSRCGKTPAEYVCDEAEARPPTMLILIAQRDYITRT